MTLTLNRRAFLGGTVAASAAVLAAPSLASFLAHPNAPTKVFEVLRQHLQLDAGHRAVVEAFTHSLQTTAVHHQSGEEFRAKIIDPRKWREVELYILQEFVASTNYLSYAGGRSRDLELVKDPLTMRPTSFN